MRGDQVYLQHLRDAIDSISEYTAEGQEQFSRNRMMQAAVVRNLEIIGEAVRCWRNPAMSSLAKCGRVAT
jgi:uncharacterized protein with HEPN domain